MDKVPQERPLVSGGLSERWDMGSGHDNDVGWCLRLDVANGDNRVILIDDVALDLAGDDSAEDAIH